MNVVIDLDGTLARWRDGGKYSAGEQLVGDWIEGAKEAVTSLLLSQHSVVVASCRCTWTAGGGSEAVLEFVRSGGFEAVPVVGLEEFPVPPGHKRTGELEGLRLIDCTAGDCHHGLVAESVPCQECGGNGVVAKPGEVGVWVGRGKPIAHWYIDDRAIPFDEILGWGNALQRLETISGEEIRVHAWTTSTGV